VVAKHLLDDPAVLPRMGSQFAEFMRNRSHSSHKELSQTDHNRLPGLQSSTYRRLSTEGRKHRHF
jgi:hypothetical protein